MFLLEIHIIQDKNLVRVRVAIPCFDCLVKANPVVKVASKTIKNWLIYNLLKDLSASYGKDRIMMKRGKKIFRLYAVCVPLCKGTEA